ncbi:hypothetical protein B2D07_00340 [Desulfococcus multivorans]|nr:hypothetical protein B2D07_00340 [Desulfococcus multivorans]
MESSPAAILNDPRLYHRCRAEYKAGENPVSGNPSAEKPGIRIMRRSGILPAMSTFAVAAEA